MGTVIAALVALKQWAAVIAAALGLARQVADTVQTHDDIQAGRDAGRAETEAAQAEEGARVEGDIADAAAHPVTEDEAIAKMKRGEA